MSVFGEHWELLAAAAAMVDEFREQCQRLLADDPAGAGFVATMANFDPRTLDLSMVYHGVPAGPFRVDTPTRAYSVPDRPIMIELLARTYAVRMKRIDRATATVPELPHDWDIIVQDQFPIFRGSGMSFDGGWGDLVMAMAAWLGEVAPDLPAFSQTKEKFAELRLYYGPGDGIAQQIIDSAEYLSEHICETCGAAGKVHNNHGWLKAACVRHTRRDPS